MGLVDQVNQGFKGMSGVSISDGLQTIQERTMEESSRSVILSTVNQGFKGISEKLGAESTNSIKMISDGSLTDLANGGLSALKEIGGGLLKILDAILMSFAGTSVEGIIASAQASAQGVMNGALESLSAFGSLTIKEAAQALASLLVMVAKVLFGILTAVIKVTSGKGLDEWATAATGALEQEASKLMAQASSEAYALTHASIAELTEAVGHFSHNVGSLMVESVSVLGVAVDIVS